MGFGSSSQKVSTFAKFDAKKGAFVIKNKNADGKWVQSGNPESYVDGTLEGLYPRTYEYKGEPKTSFQLILNGNSDPINPDLISIEFNETRVFGAILPCFNHINKGDRIALSARMKGEYCNIYVNDSNGELIKSGYDWNKVMMPMLNGIKEGSLRSFYEKQLKDKLGRDSVSTPDPVSNDQVTAMQAAAQAMNEAFDASPGQEDDDLPF